MKVEEKKISNDHGRHSDGHAPLLLFFLRCRSLGPHDDSAAPPAGPANFERPQLWHHCQKAEDKPSATMMLQTGTLEAPFKMLSGSMKTHIPNHPPAINWGC